MATTVFLLTGASGGLGGSIAKEALQRGHKVIATSRKSEKLGALRDAGAALMDLDVTASDEVLRAKMKEANGLYGRITHVVNCAGYNMAGAVEEASSQEVADLFATNVFGVTNISRASIPYLREAATETPGQPIVLAHFGSSLGWSPAPTLGHYCASKIATTLLTESMALELLPQGISTCSIEAGAFRTEFLSIPEANDTSASQHLQHSARKLPELYNKEGTPARYVLDAMKASDGTQPGDPVKAAKILVDVLTSTGVAAGRTVPAQIALGSDAVDTIRARLTAAEKNVSEWEEISKLTDI